MHIVSHRTIVYCVLFIHLYNIRINASTDDVNVYQRKIAVYVLYNSRMVKIYCIFRPNTKYIILYPKCLKKKNTNTNTDIFVN